MCAAVFHSSVIRFLPKDDIQDDTDPEQNAAREVAPPQGDLEHLHAVLEHHGPRAVGLTGREVQAG